MAMKHRELAESWEKVLFLSDGTGAGWKSGIIREMNMEIFYSKETDGVSVLLDREESAHCVKVLRHRPGDEVTVVDGKERCTAAVLKMIPSREHGRPYWKPCPAGGLIHIH